MVAEECVGYNERTDDGLQMTDDGRQTPDDPLAFLWLSEAKPQAIELAPFGYRLATV